jgi:hypothetical protein
MTKPRSYQPPLFGKAYHHVLWPVIVAPTFEGECAGASSADFGKLIADETEKWGKVIKFAGIKTE